MALEGEPELVAGSDLLMPEEPAIEQFAMVPWVEQVMLVPEPPRD